VDIDCAVTPELERELIRMAPWIHAYRFDDVTIVGRFKRIVDETTVCTRESPPDLIRRMQAAYADHCAADQFYENRELAARVGAEGSYLDIACGSGEYTFAMTELGIRDVLGVEIRTEQVEQAEFVRSLDARLHLARFEHEPVSADDPSFRSGETYDGVMSLGLLYHLTNPFQHLVNLRRLTRGALLLRTLTHAGEQRTWFSQKENPTERTHAWSGVSWIPAFRRRATASPRGRLQRRRSDRAVEDRRAPDVGRAAEEPTRSAASAGRDSGTSRSDR
jgi:2-polyprenyl-3-methyl-5-hydroxy-6-metoxy-1,4-benzoquinol methylase